MRPVSQPFLLIDRLLADCDPAVEVYVDNLSPSSLTLALPY